MRSDLERRKFAGPRADSKQENESRPEEYEGLAGADTTYITEEPLELCFVLKTAAWIVCKHTTASAPSAAAKMPRYHLTTSSNKKTRAQRGWLVTNKRSPRAVWLINKLARWLAPSGKAQDNRLLANLSGWQQP